MNEWNSELPKLELDNSREEKDIHVMPRAGEVPAGRKSPSEGTAVVLSFCHFASPWDDVRIPGPRRVSSTNIPKCFGILGKLDFDLENDKLGNPPNQQRLMSDKW
ncbi:hypothetical protein E5288_WYG000546 [Bos mutus]|uniref:Uncharacterized protein n=1 Tax=Bos mutus TaxID=72004 RepID=A0A6B0QN80_9CETA|nr:hypothetical protein [Bos mutus]